MSILGCVLVHCIYVFTPTRVHVCILTSFQGIQMQITFRNVSIYS